MLLSAVLLYMCVWSNPVELLVVHVGVQTSQVSVQRVLVVHCDLHWVVDVHWVWVVH